MIATVGPIAPPEQPDVLAQCYRRSLQVLVAHDLHTIAFPCISTGVYGFNKERAANVALTTVRQFLESDSRVRSDEKNKRGANIVSIGRSSCVLLV